MEKVLQVSRMIRGIKTLDVPTIFYDNDSDHINSMQRTYPGMMCITIPENTYPEVLKISENSGKKYYDISEFVSNTCVTYLKDEIEHAKKKYNVDIPPPQLNEGINESELNKLTQWVNSQREGDRVDIIFDWDRTLSCVEGFNPRMFTSRSGVTKEDFLLYLMGGGTRLKYLGDFFKKMQRNTNVNIFILTNNTSVQKKQQTRFYLPQGHTKDDILEAEEEIKFLTEYKIQEHFLELVKILIPGFNDDNLIPTFDYNLNGEKGSALKGFTSKKYKGIHVNRIGKQSYEALTNKQPHHSEDTELPLLDHGGVKRDDKKRPRKTRRTRTPKRKRKSKKH